MKRVKESWLSVRNEPWFYSVLLLILAPLFPDYMSFILVIASFIFARQDMKRTGRRFSVGTVGLLMLAALGYMAFSLLYSTDPVGSFWSLIMWVSLFGAYLVASSVLTDRHRLRTAMLCMTAVVGLVSFLGVGQYLLGAVLDLDMEHGLWNGLDRLVYGLLKVPFDVLDFNGRVSSTFNNPNLLAAYLVMTIPFAVAYVLTGTRSKPKALSRISLILSAYALGFSFSRGGYLAFIAVALLLFCLFINKKFVMTVLTTIYIVLLIPPVISNRLITVVPSNVNTPADSVVVEEEVTPQPPATLEELEEEISEGYAEDNSVQMRFVMWKKVLSGVVKRPLFGSGIGIQTTQKTLSAAGLEYKHAHNLFLEILAQGGLILFGFFATVLLVLMRRSLRLLKRRHNQEAWLLGFAILGACLALCVHGVFDFPLLTPRMLVTAMLLLGIAESVARVYLKAPVRELSAVWAGIIRPFRRLAENTTQKTAKRG